MKFSGISKLLLLTACSYFVNAEVTFKVIAVDGEPSVIINSKEYPMTVDHYPIYKAIVEDVSAPVEYHYKLKKGTNIIEEKFTRICDDSETLNEYFDRSITLKKLPLLPKVYETSDKFNKSKLYDDNYVSTIIIKGDAASFDKIHANPTDKTQKITGVRIIYVDPFDIKTFDNANVSINGQSTVKCKKLSYKISNLKTPEGKELYGRSAIKLRANYHDPSYIRDKLYGDILNTLGAPAPQNKFTRLIINGVEAGLYTLSDAITNSRYLRNTLNKGEKYKVPNALFKADYYEAGKVFGNLEYGAPTDIYAYKGEDKTADEKTMIKNVLEPFIYEISQYPKTNKLNFDTESFFKFMALEYAAGAIDNFWFRPGNYYVYKDIEKNYWHFLDADFHFTFGSGIGGVVSDTKPLLDATIENYAKTNTGMPNSARPLLDNLRKNPKNEAFFMDTFKKMTQTVFNLNALEARIDAMADLIREDVYWDLKLEKLSTFVSEKLKVYNFSEDDFESQVKDVEAAPGQTNNYPIKYWIKTRQESLAQQLGITIPDKVEAPLGYYEPLVHKSEKKIFGESADSSGTITNGFYSLAIITVITLILLL